MRLRSVVTHLFAVILIFTAISLSHQPTVSEAFQINGSTAPSLWVTPLVLDFGPVGVGATSQQLTATITNTGTETLQDFAGGGVYSPFMASQNCAGGVLPGESCQYFFTFSPTATGVFTTTSNSTSNAGPFSIELHGEGVGAGLHVTPLSLDFGSVYIGNSAATQSVTVRNTGLAELTDFAGGGLYPPFQSSQNCAGGVLPGESCQFFYNFSPTESGTFTTTSNVSTNAGSFAVDLQGRGRSTIFGFGQKVTPRSLDFGPVGVGFSGETLVVTITNQSLFEITDWVGGGVNPPFNALQNCAPILSPGKSCQFFYNFDPTTTGVFTTTTDVTNSAGSFTIDLRGEGMGAGVNISPLVLDFGSVPPGGTSATQVVNIKNTGLAELTDFVGGGLYSPFNVMQNCVPSVAPSDECQYFFTFSPSEWGRFTDTSNTSTNAGPFSIQVIGGLELPSIDLTFLPGRIDPGETSTIQYTLHNPNQGATLFDVSFSNAFPSGMRVASPLLYSVSPECGAPTFEPTSDATSITFEDATILGGDDCVINLNITADTQGIYNNVTGPVTSHAGNGNAASGYLQVGWFTFLPLMNR